jgi:hypothetical protein
MQNLPGAPWVFAVKASIHRGARCAAAAAIGWSVAGQMQGLYVTCSTMLVQHRLSQKTLQLNIILKAYGMSVCSAEVSALLLLQMPSLQERWITGLLAAHVLTLLSVILFRRNTTYLGVVFCVLGTVHSPAAADSRSRGQETQQCAFQHHYIIYSNCSCNASVA